MHEEDWKWKDKIPALKITPTEHMQPSQAS